MRLAISFLLIVASFAAAAPIPKSMKKSRRSFDGRWELVEMSYDGQNLNSSSKQYWDIEGTKLSIAYGGQVSSGQNYSWQKPDNSPDEAIDWRIEYTNQAAQPYVYRGLAALEGDTMIFCFPTNNNAERPPDVTAGKGRYVYTFKKIEK